MSEHCPLRPGEYGIDENLPAVCRLQCGELWDEAEDVGEYDIYGRNFGGLEDDDPCAVHQVAELENSHDGLHAFKDGRRSYVLVDQCTGCGEEYGEQAREFICPHATS